VDHRKDPTFQDAKRDEALLTVSEAIVLHGDGKSVEKALDTDEVDAVLPKILRPFDLIPRHPHQGSVVTLRNYVKGECTE